MRRYAVILVAVLALIFSSQASAFSISQFVVKPAGASLFYNFNVCGARGYRLTFQAQLEAFSGSPRSTRIWHLFEPFRCAEVQLEVEDTWTEELWETQLTIYAHGQLRRTPWTIFDNTPTE
jgi:hypothetical protein